MELGFGSVNTKNHYLDCACAKCLGHLPTPNEVVRIIKLAPPINVYSNEFVLRSAPNMGAGFLEEIIGVVTHGILSAMQAVADAVFYVVSLIKRALVAVAEMISNIDWEGIGKTLGNLMVNLNPYHLIWGALKAFPLTSMLCHNLDQLTGGMFTTMDNLSTLLGRAMRGDGISKAELLDDVLFCFRVVTFIYGGWALQVGVVAGQLKRGLLGKSPLGNAILGILEVSAIAYGAGSAVWDAAQDKSLSLVKDQAMGEALKNVRTGDPYADSFLVGAAFAGGSAAYAGTSVYDSFLGFSKQFTENTAITRLAEQIGGPLGRDIASGVVKGIKDGEVDPSKFDFTKVPSGYSLSQFTEDMAKLGSSVKDSFVDFIQSPGGSFALPNFTIDMELPHLAMPESILLPSLPSVDLSMPTISMPKIEFPSLSMPDFSWEIGDFDLGSGRKAKKRKTKVKGTNGKYYTVYLMGDGQLLYIQEADYLTWVMLAGGGLLLAASV